MGETGVMEIDRGGPADSIEMLRWWGENGGVLGVASKGTGLATSKRERGRNE